MISNVPPNTPNNHKWHTQWSFWHTKWLQSKESKWFCHNTGALEPSNSKAKEVFSFFFFLQITHIDVKWIFQIFPTTVDSKTLFLNICQKWLVANQEEDHSWTFISFYWKISIYPVRWYVTLNLPYKDKQPHHKNVWEFTVWILIIVNKRKKYEEPSIL